MNALISRYCSNPGLLLTWVSKGVQRPCTALPSNFIFFYGMSGRNSKSKSPLEARASTFAVLKSSDSTKMTPSLWLADSLLNSKIASLNTRSQRVLPSETSKPSVSCPVLLISSGHGTLVGNLSPAIAHLSQLQG